MPYTSEAMILLLGAAASWPDSPSPPKPGMAVIEEDSLLFKTANSQGTAWQTVRSKSQSKGPVTALAGSHQGQSGHLWASKAVAMNWAPSRRL